MRNILKVVFLCSIVSFWACKETTSEQEKALKNIKLNLESKISYGHFYPQREPVNSISPDSIQFKNIPSEFNDYEIKLFIFNVAQAYYQDFINGNISKEEFSLLQQIYKIDTTQVSDAYIPSKVYIVIGELKNGNRALVVDTDLNLDFENEKIQEFEYPIQFIDEEDEAFYEENKVQFLPKTKVQFGTRKNEQFVLLLDPYNENIGISTTAEKYFLGLSIPHLKTQEFTIEDKIYVLEAKSNFTQLETNPKKLQFLVFEKKDSVEVGQEVNLLRFKLNDTLHLNQYDFKLVYEGEQFMLQNLGFNEKPTGVTEGFYLPQIHLDYLDGKPYSTKLYQGKQQLFYFWTTWSLPSLEDVDRLKKLQEENDELAVVGVAVDASQGAVERMIARQQMDWNTLFATAEAKDSEKPALQFKVMSFPTYILVNEDQQIIKRTHHLKEVVEVLEDSN